MFKDVDLLAGLAAVAFAIAVGTLAQQGITPLTGTGFEVGPGTALAFGVAALSRWYRRHRNKPTPVSVEADPIAESDPANDGGSHDPG